jgi:uncharacterized protein (TIGR02246 family)
MHRKLILTTLASALLLAAAGKTPQDVKDAEKAWAEATAKGDEAALNKLLADDMVYTHSNGEDDTKAAFIANMKNGVRKYTKVNHENMDAKVYGNTAIVRATANIETIQKGKTGPAHLKWIHVWVNRDGKWQLLAHQSLRLP